MRFVVMGRIAGAYGVRGWVHVIPYTAERDALLRYPRWWINTSPRREIEVREAKMHGDGLVALLADCESREAAMRLKGHEIEVAREALPPVEDNEVYWADLIGLRVVNEAEEDLGEVSEVFAHAGHEVLRVRDGQTERLIPFVPAYVREVIMAERRIRVDWERDW